MDELGELGSALASARAGSGRAVLVTGDAGVGKTRLAQRATALAEDFVVLTGTCLPLSTLNVPLLPLRMMVGGSLGSDPAEEFDRWLGAHGAEQPVALVLDDLQWADQATLDVLMWVVAGLRARRLALLLTLRRGEVGPGHPLTRWLADVRRLPGFGELPLGPLDAEETRAQLRGLVGDEPHDSLVREVHRRTGGNAYLNELLVAGLPATATGLGDGALPGDLVSAVLRPWHQLSPRARELARVMAVGGRVARGNALADASRLAGVDDPGPLLRECVEAGVLDAVDGDGYWFHHPLQAESLEATLTHPERQRLHASFAQTLEARLSPTVPDLDSLVLIADHLYRADDVEGAYDWACRAAAAAEHEEGWGQVVRMLRRTIEVRPRVHRPSATLTDLWSRLRAAAERDGDLDTELDATEALLDLGELVPLDEAELVVRRQHLRFMKGLGFFDRHELARATQLSAVEPSSWQHAFALAEVAHAALWADDPEAPALAAEALTRARATGHPRALAYALAANAMHAVYLSHVEEAGAWGAEAVACAAQSGDGFAFGHAAMWEANAIGGNADPRWAARLAGRRQELTELGLPHPYIAWLATGEAQGQLQRGEWRECQNLLRYALGRTPGALVDVGARLQAAQLAAFQGRVHEAEGHLARADELFGETSTFLPFEFDATRAMVRIAAGDPRGCVTAALVGASTPGVPPTQSEWLMPLAARGLADLVEECRDALGDTRPLLDELDELERRFPRAIRDAGGDEFYDREMAGFDALYAAERARARRAPDRADAWLRASERLRDLLPWEECYARWRLAEALFDQGVARRPEAAAALRRAHELGRKLGAEPVLEQVASLARTARVQLAEPQTDPAERAGSAGSEQDGGAADAAHLTAREREVLGHIVAGRTYGEIARELVLSEKTVSSHVSHLLSKTGCANRVDLARWAARRAQAADAG
jgi:DNA-binding CsgD family transcriptional regulator